MKPQRALIVVLIAALAGLVWFSFHLAANRIYQVDECMEVHVARVIATGGAKTFNGPITLLQFPIAWLIRGIEKSADIFTTARILMAEIFWLNLVLIALATGEKLFSRRGAVAMFLAATLAPVWDYGFEIRHDNLMLTGVLLIWCAVRLRPGALQTYFLTGALTVVLQFVAHKAFAYTVPLSLAVLMFPPSGKKFPRWKVGVAWVVGAIAAFGAMKLFYGAVVGERVIGHGDGIKFVAGETVGASRFWPWVTTLPRLLTQTPLLLAMVAAAVVAVFVDWRRRGGEALRWDGLLPEALLCLGTLALLFVNPTPFPYNLLHFVPFAFLLAFRFAAGLDWDPVARAKFIPLAALVLVFTHLVPFAVATRRHLDWPNLRQIRLMTMAESLTDAKKDPVFDGAGLVPTRRTIDDAAFLHSLSFEAQMKQGEKTVSNMLTKVSAPVLLKNYRTDWLSESDRAFIDANYVPVADDIHVLGKILPPGGGSFEVMHPGRYRITPLDGSNLSGTYKESFAELLRPSTNTVIVAKLDGATVPGAPVELNVGPHRLETATNEQAAVFWVGPKRSELSRLEGGNHRWLFFNWY